MKKYLLAGLLAWVPIVVTVWLVSWLLGSMDSLFGVVLGWTQAVLPPSAYAAVQRLRDIPGLCVVALALLLLLTGVFVTNVVGQWFARQWHRVLQNIPIVKSIYSSVKQVSDTLFSSNGNAFREAVLVQYPRQGSWTLAFVTGKPGGEVVELSNDIKESTYALFQRSLKSNSTGSKLDGWESSLRLLAKEDPSFMH